MDLGSRYPVAFPLQKTTSQGVASCLTKLFTTFGLPDQILSHNGPNLTSYLISELLTSLNITQIKTTRYRPQSNGALERWHRDLKRMLSKLSTKDRRDWDLWLPHILFAARDTPLGLPLLNCREVRCPTSVLHHTWISKMSLPASVVAYMLEAQDRKNNNN